MAYHIMSVDDSDVAQEYIRASLADIGYESVVCYQSPLKALEDLSSGAVTPDLLLLDVMMPEIDGVDLCARIRELGRLVDTPIIMLTSRADMETLNHAFVAGANDYVTKPFDRMELRSRMRNCLRLKAELERRRPTGSGRRQIGELTAEMTEILNNKAGFQAALQAIPEKEFSRVGLIVFRVMSQKYGAVLPPDEAAVLYRTMAAPLGAVHLSAAHMFCHWGGDLFCLATLDLREDEMTSLAERFICAVAESAVCVREGWASHPVSIVATVMPPGNDPAATALGKAIAAADRTFEPARSLIQIVGSEVEPR